jgi:hypothetical protein
MDKSIIYTSLIIGLGAILLVYASGALRSEKTIRLVVKKRPRKLPPLIANLYQVLKEGKRWSSKPIGTVSFMENRNHLLFADTYHLVLLHANIGL